MIDNKNLLTRLIISELPMLPYPIAYSIGEDVASNCPDLEFAVTHYDERRNQIFAAIGRRHDALDVSETILDVNRMHAGSSVILKHQGNIKMTTMNNQRDYPLKDRISCGWFDADHHFVENVFLVDLLTIQKPNK